MGIKISFSGLVLATLLLLPGVMRGAEPPSWLKAVVLMAGFAGLALTFAGALWAIWE